jgi:hypothetical protein
VRIGANISGALSTAVNQINPQLDDLRGGNDNWRILRRFSLNDLAGGSIRIGTFGAAIGIIDGNALGLKISDNSGIDVACYEGGSLGAGLGAEINLGTAAIGALFGPYSER